MLVHSLRCQNVTNINYVIKDAKNRKNVINIKILKNEDSVEQWLKYLLQVPMFAYNWKL